MPRSINWTTPGNQKIVYQKKQKKSFHCGQNYGKIKVFHHFGLIRRAGKHCAAWVSGIWETPLEHHTTMSQMSRATNCTTPGYLVVMIIARNSCDSKFFLSVVIHVVKAILLPVLWMWSNPANARIPRTCAVCPGLSRMKSEPLPKQARYQLRYTRLFSLFIRLGVFSQTTPSANRADSRYLC